MSRIKVQNLKGTTGKNPDGYDSWIEFWEEEKGEKAIYCENMDCDNKANVGGHVFIKETTNKEYIVPLCYDCNNDRDKEFEVWDTDLISVK